MVDTRTIFIPSKRLSPIGLVLSFFAQFGELAAIPKPITRCFPKGGN